MYNIYIYLTHIIYIYIYITHIIYIYMYILCRLYVYIYIKQFTIYFLFYKFVTYLGHRHNNDCFSNLYGNITLGHRTNLASLVGTYRPPCNISWYRLKVKLILY